MCYEEIESPIDKYGRGYSFENWNKCKYIKDPITTLKIFFDNFDLFLKIVVTLATFHLLEKTLANIHFLKLLTKDRPTRQLLRFKN